MLQGNIRGSRITVAVIAGLRAQPCPTRLHEPNCYVLVAISLMTSSVAGDVESCIFGSGYVTRTGYGRVATDNTAVVGTS